MGNIGKNKLKILIIKAKKLRLTGLFTLRRQ
jgi:hypothetical protein